MDDEMPYNTRARQRPSRKRACQHDSSEDEYSSDCKKQRTSVQERTSENKKGIIASSSCNTVLPDTSDFHLCCPTNQIPTISPKDCSREINQTHLCKPDFDYQDLCKRLLYIEAIQNDPSLEEDMSKSLDESSLESDSGSVRRCNSKCASTCQSEENLPKLSVQESTFNMTFPACAISCTSIKDSTSENPLTPVCKSLENCRIGYTSESSFSSNIGICRTPPCSTASSAEPRFLQSNHLQWSNYVQHMKRESQRNPVSDKNKSYFGTGLLENQQSSEVQIPGKLHGYGNIESPIQNPYILNETAPSCSKQSQKLCYTLMCIKKIEQSISMEDITTGSNYVTIVSTNNLPIHIFNANPEVVFGAKHIGINNPEVINRIDYFKTAFGMCHIKSSDAGKTQVLLIGINPNGENIVLGSVCPSCKLDVCKDIRGTRHVVLHIS